VIKIELLKSPGREVQEDQIRDALKFLEDIKENVKLRGKKMKLDTVNLSLV
jgi:hypothetical protein